MADPKKLLEATTSTMGLCNKIEKAQGRRRIKKFFVGIWNWMRGKENEQKTPTGQFPYRRPPT